MASDRSAGAQRDAPPVSAVFGGSRGLGLLIARELLIAVNAWWCSRAMPRS